MPYIKQPANSQFVPATFNGEKPKTPGELNFVLTKTVLDYLLSQGHVNYTRINDVIGAMEAAKLEFYRRFVVPYEETKMRENGDVYP